MVKIKINIFLLFNLLLLLNSNAQKLSINYNSIECIDDLNNITQLDSIFNSSKLILLGEAGHGDGATFELKGRIVDYLFKKHGYTIFLFEGGGFIESLSFNLNKTDTTISNSYIFNNTSFDYFAKSNELLYLKNAINNYPNIKYYGIDCQTGNYEITLNNFNTLSTTLKIRDVTENEVVQYFKNVISLYKQSLGKEEFTLKKNEIESIAKQTDSFLKKLNTQSPKQTNNIQILLNIKAIINIFLYNIHEMAYSKKSINTRDSIMASNILYITKKYPNEKVIVSAANFHVSKSMQFLINNSDSLYYQTIYSMGTHLIKNYSDSAYSIAITSSSGKQGYCTDTVIYDIIKDAKFIIDSTTLEVNLLIYNCNYSFYNFKNNPSLDNNIYRSLIFGSNMHRGKWSTAFDGVINIRNQKPSTKIKDE